MKARPVTLGGLASDIAARIVKVGATRVAVDGAPTAAPETLAGRIVDAVHGDGGHAVHIPAGGFLRQASLRLERGRTNPDAYYEDWLDLRAITREVLTPAAPGGTGRVLPSLWDPVTDRATRAPYLDLPAGTVVVVSGTMLLGAGLDFDVTVHLTQTAAAIARRTPPELQWTLPAFQRYHDEAMPHEYADVVVRADDPRHPAVVL
ncbi:uridine kinase [Dactylosporangium sp. NPDC006015]|uniref:uridine kinase n=1 Tax=Dactylosporangium sp. NPDC006015 TaxID=3154576 RepID=UPI0033BA4FB2